MYRRIRSSNFSITFFIGFFLFSTFYGHTQDCSKWLFLPSDPSFVDIGDLDISGDQVTIEAIINRTQPYLPGTGDFNEGDVVSKHLDPSNVNYLLRPNHCYITTTNGFFGTPDICEIKLNQVYHIAMVYNGKSLKFYRNGILMSQVPASGNLFQNNFPARVGRFPSLTKSNFIGYINEVRIWNVARTQSQINEFKNSALPSPTTQNGLLAYYIFDNLKNKQGDISNDGKLVGPASINEINPNCTISSDSCGKELPTETNTSFFAPDTVCVNTPFNINNTSAGAKNFYWNFCVADLKSAPSGENIGNIGGQLSLPVFMDYVLYNGNYYGFLTNNHPGALIRLDFGNSLLNTPNSVNLGNFNGILPPQIGTEGIQMVFNEGRWYAIIVSGHPPEPDSKRIIKIDFGPDLTNTNPSATNWGNLGGLSVPVDLHVFKEGNNWYGLTVNADNNTITRINFTDSFGNTPTAENLGNIGNLSYPTGIYAISDNGYWRVFVVNGGDNTRTDATFSLTRLDFGSSLLNTPRGTNLGNPGNMLQHPRDITILKQCGQLIGFAVNGKFNKSNMIQMDFGNSLTSTPTMTTLGVVGNSSFPHSISKLFRVKDDVYGFVTNVDNNTITRLKFSGCSNASISSSQLQNPAPIVYNKPGTYNINLTTDEGLATQDAFCKQIVVVASFHTPLQTRTICEGDSTLLSSSTIAGNLWNDGTTGNVIHVKKAGMYWVQSINNAGCSNIDSFLVVTKPLPRVNLGVDTAICEKGNIVLDAGGSNSNFIWQDGSTGKKFTVMQAGTYHVAVTKDGCTAKDTIAISIKLAPKTHIEGNKAICRDGSTAITASGGETYVWSPSTGLSDAFSGSVIASPASTTTYQIAVTGQNGCTALDSVKIVVSPKPIFTVASTKPVLCMGDTLILKASGGDNYSWFPAVNVASPGNNETVAFPITSTNFKVIIEEFECGMKDSLYIYVPVVTKPLVNITKSNDINCFIGHATLTTGGGSHYLWRPGTGLSDPNSARQVVRNNITTTYHVEITTAQGCKVEDSVTVFVSKGDDGTGFPVPAAFTPNNDGKNDCFGVGYWGDISAFSMQVFNRWGAVVFQSQNPENCWSGIYKGQLHPPDVYVYLIKAKTMCGNIIRKGTVTLIR